jgi:hypothetical protein
MFEYDHRLLSLNTLHKNGIRSVKDLEEVIEWEYSSCIADDKTFGFTVYLVTGLTKNCKGICVMMTVHGNGRFVILDATIPQRDELLLTLSQK